MPPTDAGPAPDAYETEVVQRPTAGTLASGRWEAPAWAFYGAGGLVLLAGAVYAGLHTARFGRRARRRRSTPQRPPSNAK